MMAGIVAVASAISVWVFITVDAGSHSVSDTLYGSAVPIGLVWLVAVAALAAMARTMEHP
jgi:hypothetical protein